MKPKPRSTHGCDGAIKEALASVAAMRSPLEAMLEANLTAATTAQLGLLRILDLMSEMRTGRKSSATDGAPVVPLITESASSQESV